MEERKEIRKVCLSRSFMKHTPSLDKTCKYLIRGNASVKRGREGAGGGGECCHTIA